MESYCLRNKVEKRKVLLLCVGVGLSIGKKSYRIIQNMETEVVEID